MPNFSHQELSEIAQAILEAQGGLQHVLSTCPEYKPEGERRPGTYSVNCCPVCFSAKWVCTRPSESDAWDVDESPGAHGPFEICEACSRDFISNSDFSLTLISDFSLTLIERMAYQHAILLGRMLLKYPLSGDFSNALDLLREATK